MSRRSNPGGNIHRQKWPAEASGPRVWIVLTTRAVCLVVSASAPTQVAIQRQLKKAIHFTGRRKANIHRSRKVLLSESALMIVCGRFSRLFAGAAGPCVTDTAEG